MIRFLLFRLRRLFRLKVLLLLSVLMGVTAIWAALPALVLVGSTDLRPVRGLLDPPEFLDRSGNRLLNAEWPNWIGLEELWGESALQRDTYPQLIELLIKREDAEFLENPLGVSPRGTARAVLGQVGVPGFSGGGSTIPMQLAKKLFEGDLEETGRRHLAPAGWGLEKVYEPAGKGGLLEYRKKLSQMVVAVWLKRAFDDQELLELYLNIPYWGGKTRGIEAASLEIFGKPAREATTFEQITLITFVQKPMRARYPDGGELVLKDGSTVRIESWEERYNRVVGVLQANGHLSASELLPAGFKWERQPPKARQSRPEAERWALRSIRAELGRRGLAPEPGERVATTLDLALQWAVASALERLPHGVEGSVGVVGPGGEVLAVGGDHEALGRGWQSTLKALEYAAAFEAGSLASPGTLAQGHAPPHLRGAATTPARWAARSTGRFPLARPLPGR